jgi:broad specificity phosphatase PhoE
MIFIYLIFLILYYSINNKINNLNLYFIRHAKGLHNDAAIKYGDSEYNNSQWFDAPLIEEGIKESIKFKNLINIIKPDLVYSSPLQRTIETMYYSLNRIDIPIFIDDNIREKINGHPCNFRNNKNHIILNTNLLFKNTNINYDYIWDFEYNKIEKIPEDIIIRGHKWFDNMIEYVKDKNIKNIIIYTHGGFIQYFLNTPPFDKLNTNFRCHSYPKNLEICLIKYKY